MKYSNVDQILEDMSAAYAIMNAKPDVKEVLETIGELRLHIHYTDLDSWVTQVIENGEVQLVRGQDGEAPVVEHIDSESFVKIMTGEADPPELAMAGKINFEGDFGRVLVLVPLLMHTVNAFREIQAGR